MQKNQKNKAKLLTDAQILDAVKKYHLHDDYDKYKTLLIEMLDGAAEDSQEALAGFMFAFSAVSNEIARRNNIR